MSRLEARAKPILTPLILDQASELLPDDQRQIAVWALKTALVAMLSSSEGDRGRGYGVPPTEYATLYANRERPEPPSHSQFWIGRYTGGRPAAIRNVPLTLELEDIPELEVPSAYLVTLTIGALLVQGVRFTTPHLFVEVTSEPELPRIWPTQPSVAWPPTPSIDDELFEAMIAGKALHAEQPGVGLVPFKPATDLEPSTIEGSMVKQPTPCGKHYVYFPAGLMFEAILGGKRFAFIPQCGCGIAYLVVLEADGAHFRNDGTLAEMIDVVGRIRRRHLENSKGR